jgi:hypothetical protein
VRIRHYVPGDETAQAEIYNAAAGQLPGCKPASADNLRQRTGAEGFDPSQWIYAELEGTVVGYCLTQANGRIGFPWHKAGFEHVAEPLFSAALGQLRSIGLGRAYAAYPSSWTCQAEFFIGHGFVRSREMVNFVQEVSDLPTLLARPVAIDSMRPTDVTAVAAMAPELWRGRSPAQLERDWFDNPQLPADSLFVIRSRTDEQPLSAGRLVENPTYADAKAVDPTQPCFRLGAFGTEGLTHKRINGLFSLVVPRARSAMPVAHDLLAYAASRMAGTAASIAAQVPSDVPHLLGFFQTHFRQQASFPVFERDLHG